MPDDCRARGFYSGGMKSNLMNEIMRWICIAGVVAFYVVSATTHTAPDAMFAGLAPLVLIGAEAAWCLFP